MNPDCTKTICFIVPEINNSYYLDAIDSIQKYTTDKNYNLYIAPTNNSQDIEKTYSRSIINLNIEGVIVALSDKNANIAHLQELLDHRTPTIFLNKTDHAINATQIIPDIFHGTYKAVNHLLYMGCKNIHIYTGDLSNPLYSEMVEGYQSAMSDSGIKFKEDQIISGSLSPDSINFNFNKLHDKSKLPDGIISPNSATSMHITSWLRNNAYEIPKDVLLVSFESDKYNLCVTQNLSTVEVSGSKTGKVAAEKLFKQIEDRKLIKETIIIPTKFIIKGSTMRL
ncbi:MAG: substrate-binding domain-containing protein [Bacteroidota bacterium]